MGKTWKREWKDLPHNQHGVHRGEIKNGEEAIYEVNKNLLSTGRHHFTG